LTRAKLSSGMTIAENPHQIRLNSKQNPNIHLLSWGKSRQADFLRRDRSSKSLDDLERRAK
jgi:hypothetical protein